MTLRLHSVLSQTHLIHDPAAVVAPHGAQSCAGSPRLWDGYESAGMVTLINGWVGLEAAPHRGRRGKLSRPRGPLGTNKKGDLSLEGSSRFLAFTVAADACH